MNTDEGKFKTHDYIAFFVLTALVSFGVLSYYVAPKDVEQVKEIVRALVDAMGMILAFKFGVHVAQPPPGTTTLTASQTPGTAPPNPPAPIGSIALAVGETPPKP